MKTWKILVFAGALLLLVGCFSPLVLLQIETLSTIPADGATYTELTLVQLVAPVNDLGGGNIEYAVAVKWYLDGSTTPLILALTEDLADHKTFSASTTTPAIGSHTYQFVVTWHRSSDGYEWDEPIPPSVGMPPKAGTFTIVAGGTLTGKWYINNLEVTSPDQIIVLHVNSVTFRFMKTSITPSDSEVTCKILGLPTTVTLPNMAAAMWETTVDIPNGSYTLTLEASTSNHGAVTMALYSFTMFGTEDGDGGFTLNFGYISVAGLVCIGIGLFLKFKGRKT